MYKSPLLYVRPLPSGDILNVKRNLNGRHERFKEHLIVRGKLQTNIHNASEMYGPVACIEMIRLMFTVASRNSWCVHSLDYTGAFYRLHFLQVTRAG